MRGEQVAVQHSIDIAPTGYRSIRALKDKKLKREIAKAIDGLAKSPELQGKELVKPLEGVRSVRAAQGRFRILYKVDAAKRLVSVLLVGERRPGEATDVYAVAQRLLKLLLGRP
ncbi:MAG: type II toxin-antitoxin system RelE/ParE family toxin [Planctomycetes bacterium]|nr:type II toxin-antitoxin system RelE/ParE family toxin [Planctomycetota bacterium]